MVISLAQSNRGAARAGPGARGQGVVFQDRRDMVVGKEEESKKSGQILVSHTNPNSMGTLPPSSPLT